MAAGVELPALLQLIQERQTANAAKLFKKCNLSYTHSMLALGNSLMNSGVREWLPFGLTGIYFSGRSDFYNYLGFFQVIILYYLQYFKTLFIFAL
jgi:hypothetical protein